MPLIIKKDALRTSIDFYLERKTRFELATFALARQRSTTEPLPHTYLYDDILNCVQRAYNVNIGGSYRTRTYDPLLVRQML